MYTLSYLSSLFQHSTLQTPESIPYTKDAHRISLILLDSLRPIPHTATMPTTTDHPQGKPPAGTQGVQWVRDHFGVTKTPCVRAVTNALLAIAGREDYRYRVACRPCDALRIGRAAGLHIRYRKAYTDHTVSQARHMLPDRTALMIVVGGETDTGPNHLLLATRDHSIDTWPPDSDPDDRRVLKAWEVTVR